MIISIASLVGSGVSVLLQNNSIEPMCGYYNYNINSNNNSCNCDNNFTNIVYILFHLNH